MQLYIHPDLSTLEQIRRRPSSSNEKVNKICSSIIERVKSGGDKALKEIVLEIEGRDYESFEISQAEISRAKERVDAKVIEAIHQAASNIKAFHSAQMPKRIEVETQQGVLCVQKPVAIQKVGLYIPGGTAPLFSTVLMLAIPAKLAGCREIVLCSPAGKNGAIADEVLCAASICGVDKVFALGGAQAIAAMAYGTESVPAVDKIFGPGNQYVTAAKQIVASQQTAIDMPAGPSEVMVLADTHTNPAFAAADLLSQAEHGRDSQVILVCESEEFAQKVMEEVKKQTSVLGRRELAEAALSQSSAVVVEGRQQMLEIADIYAPEHLIILCDDPWEMAEKVQAAGSVFVGEYTPESAGDYASGTNHTLPTCGWARSYSGVNIDSFMRKMTLQSISKQGLQELGSTIINMAEAEGLQAHGQAVRIRLENE